MSDDLKVTDELWEKWSGRSFRARQRQEELYGIRLTGEGDGLSISQLAKQLHDFLADNAPLSQIRRGKEINQAFRELKLRELTLSVGAREGHYVSSDEMNAFAMEWAAVLRGILEDLEKVLGRDRMQPFYERLAAARKQWIEKFGGGQT